MTSEKSYINWLKEAGRGHMAAVLAWGSYCLLLGSVIIRLQFDLLAVFFGIGNNRLLFFLCTGLGAALGLLEFSYLLQEKKQDFYYSLPVKKSTIFYTRYLHGLLHGLMPMVCYMFICGIYQSSIDPVFMEYSVGYTFYSIWVYGILFLLFYHITIFSVCVCGQIVSVLCMLGLILCGMQFFLKSVCLVFMKSFYETFFRSPFLEILEKMLVPWKLGEMLTMQGVYEKFRLLELKPEMVFPAAGLGWIVIFLVLTVFAVKHRKAESVGRIFTIPAAGKITGIVLGILSGTGICGILLTVSHIAEMERLPAILCLETAGITAVFTVHFLHGRLVLGGKAKRTKNKKLRLTAECAATAVIVAVLAGRADSYDSYLPEEEEVESLGIAAAGLDMDMDTYHDMKKERTPYLIDSRMKRYTMQTEGKEAGMRWIRMLRAEAESKGAEPEGESEAQVTVCFEKRNGSNIYRTYDVSKELLLRFADVYETEEYKRAAYPLITEDAEVAEGARFIWDDGVNRKTLKLTEEEKAEFLALYQSDVKALEMADLQKGFPAGSLEIQSEIYDRAVQTMIYPTFEKCCAFLNTHGADPAMQVSDYPITGITIWKTQTAPIGSSGGTSMHRYEAEDAAEWKGRLIPKKLCNQPLLCPPDTSIDAEADVLEQESGAVISVECYGKYTE